MSLPQRTLCSSSSKTLKHPTMSKKARGKCFYRHKNRVLILFKSLQLLDLMHHLHNIRRQKAVEDTGCWIFLLEKPGLELASFYYLQDEPSP